MPLFMPTNISPSTLGALGNGTVDAEAGFTASWQVNGNVPMTAYEIKIMANSAESSVLYSTGKTALFTPFYGVDEKGNPVFFEKTITAGTLAGAGITNGNSYKMVITQWWSETESVTQQSASVFLCRSAPELKFFPLVTDADKPFKTVYGQYKQAQGDPIAWVRWRLISQNDPLHPLDDTGNIATAKLEYEMNGLIDGEDYAVRCTVETVNGVAADTGWTAFSVKYGMAEISAETTATVMPALSGVKLQWPKLRAIDAKIISGKVTGDAGAFSLWSRNGDSHIQWDISTDRDPLPKEFSDISVFWDGQYSFLDNSLHEEPSATTGTVFQMLCERDGADDFTVKVQADLAENQIKVTYTVSAEGVCEPVVFADLDEEATTQFLFSGEELQFIAKRTVNGAVITERNTKAAFPLPKMRVKTLDVFALFSGFTAVNKIWMATGVADLDTDMSWSNGNTFFDVYSWARGQGGGAVSESVPSTLVFRLDEKEGLALCANTMKGQNGIIDCAVKTGRKYRYHVLPTPSQGVVEGALLPARAAPCLWDWTILSCSEREDGSFCPEAVFRFQINVDSGNIANNNKPSILENFTQFPTLQRSMANYKSGTLSGYLGGIDKDRSYFDTREARDALYALSCTENVLFLKNRKGDIWRVAIAGAISVQTKDNTRQQAQIAAVPWVEVGDAEDVKIFITQNDALWS